MGFGDKLEMAGAITGPATTGAAFAAGPYAFAAMAGLQVVTGLHNAEVIRANARIQKQINEMNAQFAEIDASNAEIQGYTDETRYQGMIDDTIKNIDFAYTVNQVDSDFGTARSVKDQARNTGFLNQLDIQAQARAKALGYRQEARSIRTNSFMAGLQSKQQAQSAVTASLLNAGQTALSGYEYSQGKK